MKGKKKGSDLWGEFWEKESGKSESPLATKMQGREKTHPAEKREIVRSPFSKENVALVTCYMFHFSKMRKIMFLCCHFLHFCTIKSYLCNVYMLGFGGSGLL